MGMPKALVTDDRGSWLLRGVHALAAGGCQRVTVVLGAEVGRAAALLADRSACPDGGPDGRPDRGPGGDVDVEVVVADDWAEGMGASLRAGLRALGASEDDGAVVSLVDLPDLVPAVVARVVAAASGPAALARAAYDGRPGHPVLLGRDHWPGVVEAAVGDQGARAYLAGRDDVVLVECGDLASGLDVDSRSIPDPTGGQRGDK